MVPCWYGGDATAAGRETTIAKYGFADVLTVSSMIQDRNRWMPAEWGAFITDTRRWTTEMFDRLVSLTGTDLSLQPMARVSSCERSNESARRG